MIGKHHVTFVVAMDRERGIGKNGTLPWRLPKELAHFHRVTRETRDPTKQNMVVMGRTTWESIPEHRRPLADRKNVVLSHGDITAHGATVAHSLEDAFALADNTIETIHIIGGGRVFTETIAHPFLDTLYITEVDGTFACDTFFPEIPKTFSKKETLGRDCDNGTCYTFYKYSK